MSDNETRKNIIENYITAYNNFDVEGMLKDLDSNVIFRNIANGTVNLLTNGIDEFRRQAVQAKELFSRREQKITGLKFGETKVEAEISFRGTIAVDLPNGLKAGSQLELNGKSVFRFNGDKITAIEDIA